MARLKRFTKGRKAVSVMLAAALVIVFFIPVLTWGVWLAFTKTIGPSVLRSREEFAADFPAPWDRLFKREDLRFSSYTRARWGGGRWAAASVDCLTPLSQPQMERKVRQALEPDGWKPATAEEFHFFNWPGLDAGPPPSNDDVYLSYEPSEEQAPGKGVPPSKRLVVRFRLEDKGERLAMYCASEKRSGKGD